MNELITTKPMFLRKLATCAFTGLGKSTLEELVQKGEFPRPYKISPGSSAWLVRELEEWGELRPVSDLLPPANTGAKKGGVMA